MICSICGETAVAGHLDLHVANGEAARRVLADGAIEYYRVVPSVLGSGWLRSACHDLQLERFLKL